MKIEYRKLDGVNYSSVRLFDESPIDFYRTFILKEEQEQKNNKSLDIGDMVDFYLLECQGDKTLFDSLFDERYSLYTEKKGNNQAHILAECLFKLTKRDLREDKVVTSFTDRFKEAIEIVQKDKKYQGKTFEQILDDFNKKGKDYRSTDVLYFLLYLLFL